MNNTSLITGGCGFSGSNFIQYILANTKYRNVINLDKLTYAGNPNNLLDIQKDERYIFIQGDICDHNCVRNIFKEYNPSVVVHLRLRAMLIDPLMVHSNLFKPISLVPLYCCKNRLITIFI